ncbi:MAG TPA: AAA family ATPase, partial [Candidatus Binatia bacterium]|nr:AAA family ATPase [Candidatus Binatia bacterium]
GGINRLGAKFCKKCGQQLLEAALSSLVIEGKFGSVETYTPKHLAEKILRSKSALEGERKQVTVLFADMKGSMELLVDRDPEEARKLLDPVLEHMMEAVHRYEGTVNQVMGDGIMALFGAPLAHEDHAVRACYAALRMQDSVKRDAEGVFRRYGVPVEIRVGLNSGEVVVRAIGSDLHMDYTAVGQTTHLAARMEQMARPGTILLAPDTLALAEGFVQVMSRGPVPVKGLAAPIEIFELGGASPVRSRLHAAVSRGLTRFVGRDAEIELLQKALGRAGEGHGQVVAVVGEPGVGKSRLVWEFTHSHRSQGWLVLETASVSYGKATTYFPVIELLRSYFCVEPRDDDRKMREKVTGKLLSLDRVLEPTLPVFLSLLDVPVEDAEWMKLDPPLRRRKTLEALKLLLLRESQVQPVLLVVEDLHWIDSATQAWLELLVESLPTARLLVLVNYRPEYVHGWGSKTYYQQVLLDALPLASAAELLEALLGTGRGLEDLRRLLIDRTQGNPFFLEESVRTLVETRALTGERGAYRLAGSVQTLQLPATAQAILAARIDRLAPEDKQLLQVAAVVGKDVPFALLEAIAEQPEDRLREALARLQATELLYEARLFPELEYTFKHALTHEVAYAGLLQDRRRALHACILEAMERLYTDRLDEHVERLAHHATRGDVHEKAAHYLRRAGNKAAARSALRDARACYEQALGVLEALPTNQSTLEQGYETRLELRTVLTQLAELRPALERLREAETLSERLNDDHRRARVCSVLMTLHTLLGELDEAVATGTRALEMAGRLGDLRLRILTTSYLEQAQYYRGEYERVVELATDALAVLPADWIYEHFGMVAPASVYARSWLVISLAELGRFAEAAEHSAEAIRLAEPTHHAYTIGLAHRAAGTFHLLAGDWAKARSLLEHGITVLRTGNVSLSLPHTLVGSAWALAQLGATSDALIRLRDGEQALADHATAGMRRAWDDYVVGRTWLLLGRLDEARAIGERAVELLPSQPAGAAHALHLLGDVATHPDRLDAESGEIHYRKALALAERHRMRPLVAHCHLALGSLYRRTDKRQQAREHFTIATTMYREMAMGFWLVQADGAMAALA